VSCLKGGVDLPPEELRQFRPIRICHAQLVEDEKVTVHLRNSLRTPLIVKSYANEPSKHSGIAGLRIQLRGKYRGGGLPNWQRKPKAQSVSVGDEFRDRS
jgi:hypothetical protein